MSATALKAWRWILAGVFLCLAGVAITFYILTRRRSPGVGVIAVSAIEAAYAPAIASKVEELRVLEHEAEHNFTRIAEITESLERHRASLDAVYTTVGMTDEEILERLRRLKL